MSSINEIEKTLEQYFFGKDKIFSNIKAIVTAGPTREYMDPVRYISNESSGKQGYEIAKKLYESGFNTTLITGPTNINYPKNMKVVKVTSAKEMFASCQNELPADIAICTAAVADFYPHFESEKIKKDQLENEYSLKLNKNIDILEYLSNHNQFRPRACSWFCCRNKKYFRKFIKKITKEKL